MLDTKKKEMLKRWFGENSLRPELAIKNFYQLLREAKVAIDLGANNGFHSLGFAQSHKDSQVIAVEANIDTYGILCEKIKEAELSTKINPLWVAVQDDPNVASIEFNNCIEQPGRSGIIPFWFDVKPELKKGMTYAPAVDVPATTVDQIVTQEQLKSVDFIKADLEGGEYKAFLGATETLRKYRPSVVFERSIEAEKLYGYERFDWFTLFDSVEYTLVTFWGEKMSPDEYYDFWYFYAFPSENLEQLLSLVKSSCTNMME